MGRHQALRRRSKDRLKGPPNMTTKLALLSLSAALLMTVGCGIEKPEDDEVLSAPGCEAGAANADGIFGCMSASTNRRIIAGQGGLSPAALASLRLWLRADRGVTEAGGVVSRWNDQSGRGNDCVSSAITTTVNSSQGGRRSLLLSGAGLGGAARVVPAGSARTVILVAWAHGLGGPSFQMGGFPTFSCEWWDFGGAGGNVVVYEDGNTNVKTVSHPTVAHTSPVIYEMTWDGNIAHNPALRLNGIAQAIGNYSGVSGTTSDPGSSGYLIRASDIPGDAPELFELAAFDTVLSDVDLSSIRTGYSVQYQIPLAAQ
jgi:hypothetical protein